ncbi:MAG: sigma-70 family RNA polymerase sigma factor [Kineosporiaceae bacterium]
MTTTPALGPQTWPHARPDTWGVSVERADRLDTSAPAASAPDRELDFDAFVAARGASLVRTAAALLKNPHDAEDVVQDVLAKAHLHWATVQRAGSPDAYVRRMLVNACTSFWRRAVRRERSTDTADLIADLAQRGAGPDVARVTTERELMVALLRQLPTKQRAVLVLRHYEDLDDAAIADALGMSTVAVRGCAHRALIRMRGLLDAATADARPATVHDFRAGETR